MCFYIDYSQPTEKIASEDIECYKIVRTWLFSLMAQPFYFTFFTYVKNIKRNLGVPLTIKEGEIGAGFHSYTCKEEAKKEMENLSLLKPEKLTIAKFIIPKGARYYESYNREYVSNKIMYVGAEETYRVEA